MTPSEKSVQFSTEFGEMLNRAVNSGVPLPNIIMHLGNAEFEMRWLLNQLQKENQAREIAHKIIPAGAIKFNGHR